MSNQLRVAVFGNRRLAIDAVRFFVNLDSVHLSIVANKSDDGLGTSSTPSLIRFAEDSGLQWCRFDSLRNADTQRLIESMKLDLIISCSYDRIIPKEIFSLPTIGAFNVHYALLPLNRGCLPIVWTIASEGRAGVTLHWINEGIDTGDIVLQKEVDRSGLVTAEILNDRCGEVGLVMIRQLWGMISSGAVIPRIKQPESAGTYHPFIFPYDRWVQWSLSAKRVATLINSLTFDPHPCARTLFNHKEIQVLGPASESKTGPEQTAEAGIAIAQGNYLFIGCGDNSFVKVPLEQFLARNPELKQQMPRIKLASPVVEEIRI